MRRLRVTGLVAITCALGALAGCSSSPKPPASPLDRSSPLTCRTGAHACTSPGAVRWSVPLSSSAQFDISTGLAILNMPGMAAGGIASFGEIPNGYLASVTVAPGLVVLQQGRAVIEAVDPATGRQLWRTRLPMPPGFSSNTDVSGALPITMVVANGMITAYDQADYTWWLVNASTGAAGPPRRLGTDTHGAGAPADDVLPVTADSVALLGDTRVQGVDPATGSVRWQVPLRPWTGYARVGHVLYFDDDRYRKDLGSHSGLTNHERATAIQRVDLASGRALPALPLATDLRGLDGQVAQPGEDPGALLFAANGVVARIDPATGRPAWTRRLPDVDTEAMGQAGPATAPSLEYLEPGPAPDALGPPPSPGAHANIWRVLVVSLATGQATATALGRAFPYSAAGINTSNGGGGSSWNLYGRAMLATHSTRRVPSGGGGYRFVRLEGVDPHSGRILWRGPWAGDLYVLGETFTGPPVIIAESCAPGSLAADQSGIHGDEAFCDGERLYAINA